MRLPIISAFLSFSVLASAQTDVALRIDHKAGQDDFDGGSSWTTPAGEEVEIDRLEYYLSMFTIVHDGGQETPIEGAYVLADAFVDEVHALGEVSGVENVEGLKFSVGIDPENNHADPASWPNGHPLAPQVPSMHWGWSAGYRFIALEGGAGINGVVAHEIHALGDDNHTPGQMEVAASVEDGVLILDVEADVFGFYNTLSVAGGLINHGEDGEAVTVCNNLADHVFRLPGASNIEAPAAREFGFDLVSLEGGAELIFHAPLATTTDIELLDVLGRPLQRLSVSVGTVRYTIVDVRQGAFLISVTSGIHRTTRRWIQG